MNPKIVIPHSWSRNMGDLAMLKAIVSMLSEVSPGSRIIALVSEPEFTMKRFGTTDTLIEGWPWPLPFLDEPAILKAFRYPFIFLNNLASAAIYRISKRRAFLFNQQYSKALLAIFESDIVISPGGDFVSPRYVFMTAFGEFIMARILGKRLIILAQTIGPFKGILWEKLAGFVLRLADLVVVRERESARHLHELGVQNVQIAADLAFTFPAMPKAQRLKRVVLCPKMILRDIGPYTESMKKLARRIEAELGYEVVFLPTDSHDIPLQTKIAKEAGMNAIGEVLSPEEIAVYLSQSSFLVSSRMHAAILGANSSTPFISIGDSHKFEGVLGELYKGCDIDIKDFDENGIDRIMDAIRRKDEIADEIMRNYPKVRDNAMRNTVILMEKFSEWDLQV